MNDLEHGGEILGKVQSSISKLSQHLNTSTYIL